MKIDNPYLINFNGYKNSSKKKLLKLKKIAETELVLSPKHKTLIKNLRLIKNSLRSKR